MKLCKKIVAAAIIAAMLCCCIPAFADGPEYPEVPEGYDGYITFAASALTMGWGYIIEPVLVPVHEGETFAAVTIRALETLNWGYSATGTVEEGFYLTGIGCYETEPKVPEYLMSEILAYPEWAEENLGYSFGEWTGIYEDDNELTNYEYCTLSGWMFLDNEVTPSEGADTYIVTAGHVYTWFFTIYGWGMDYGVSDGWGCFPLFDNPMEGVSRTNASEALALIFADEELAEIAEGFAAEELEALYEVMNDPTSTQEMIDNALEALLAAIENYGQPHAMGDVNMDGKLDSADALLVMRYAMNVQQLSEGALALAEMNGDGSVDFADALLILRAALNVSK